MTFAFFAIGTQWEIESAAQLDEELRRTILDRIERFDATYSRFRPDSVVSQIARARRGGRFDFPDDAIVLFDLYDQLAASTAGAVDPLVGRDLELLGYDANYSLTPAPASARAEHEALGRSSWSRDIERNGSTIVTQRPLLIDVGAAGKGYLVDLIAQLLREAGFGGFVVDGSGDVLHAGDEPIRVGLEHPADPNRVIGVAELRNAALCASATNRRAWSTMHHVLDGRTGLPTRDVIATWAVADSGALADGLATALFFTKPRQLAERFDFTYVRVLSNGRIESSNEFAGELFV